MFGINDRDIAAVWPCTSLLAPLPVPEEPAPTHRLWRRLLARRPDKA